MSFLVSWFVMAVAFWLTAELLEGVSIRDFTSAIIVSGLFGLLNFFLGWFISLIFYVGTLGIGFLFYFITRFIVDAIILKLTDSFTDRLKVVNFPTALWAAVLISLIGTVGQWALETIGFI